MALLHYQTCPPNYAPPSSSSLMPPPPVFRASPVCISTNAFILHAHISTTCSHPGRRFDCRARRSLRISSAFDVVAEKGPCLQVEFVASPPSAPPAAASSTPEATGWCHSSTFQSVATEKDLLRAIQKEVEARLIPPKAGCGMEELYYNYRDAVREGGLSNEKIVKIMATVLDRILLQFEEPYTFPSYHVAIRGSYDYYTFGQNYIRPLVDFRNSFIGNATLFDEVEQQMQQGHNVVLFANHQTEADPAVMALLLESRHPYLAENITYIAGDRVVLDPFCKPFSMGRNLLCVYSKKHISDIPELADMQRKANARALKELALLLREGGKLIWIAPSGGRDRPDPKTSRWMPEICAIYEELECQCAAVLANTYFLNFMTSFLTESHLHKSMLLYQPLLLFYVEPQWSSQPIMQTLPTANMAAGSAVLLLRFYMPKYQTCGAMMVLALPFISNVLISGMARVVKIMISRVSCSFKHLTKILLKCVHDSQTSRQCSFVSTTLIAQSRAFKPALPFKCKHRCYHVSSPAVLHHISASMWHVEIHVS